MPKWVKHHQKANTLADLAHDAQESGDEWESKELYLLAAEEEEKAVDALYAEALPRTRAILSVSAVALAYKSGDMEYFSRLRNNCLNGPDLPAWAEKQIDEMGESAEIIRLAPTPVATAAE